MELGEALQVVYDLALENGLEPVRGDDDLMEERGRQQIALDVVHDFIVNQFGID